MESLKELNQNEIIERYNKASEQKQKDFIYKYNQFEKTGPGRIKDNLKRVKVLLKDSKNNVNPFQYYTSRIPLGFNIRVWNGQFCELDKLDFEEIHNTVFY